MQIKITIFALIRLIIKPQLAMKPLSRHRYKVFQMRLREIQLSSKERVKRGDILTQMIYTDYINLIKSVSKENPILYKYISMSFYYDTIAAMYGITPKYVSRIINNYNKKL